MRPPTRKRWKKRPFILLEILIALTLVALLFFPLIRPHLHIQKSAAKELLFEQLTKEADLYFLDFKQQLYEHSIAWDQLYKGGEKDLETSDQCPYLTHQAYRRADKKRSYGHNYLLLDVTFTFTPKNDRDLKIPFTYSLLVEKTREG